MKHVPFSKITGFQNVVKHSGWKYPHIQYRSKVKLHGTNAAVQIRKNEIAFQSRNRILKGGNDHHFNFYIWANTVDWLSSLKRSNLISNHIHKALETEEASLTIFGEWIGQGVQKTTSASQIENKAFCIFAAYFKDVVITEPTVLKQLVPDNPRMFVIPWYGRHRTLYFSDMAFLEKQVKNMNRSVYNVERRDPFIAKNFGVEGIGEGLVYYPVSSFYQGQESKHADVSMPFVNHRKSFIDELIFKAKGSKHAVSKQKKAVQMEFSDIKEVQEFSESVATPNRMEQIVLERFNNEFDKRHIGPFIGAVCKDISDECADQIEESGLNWKQCSSYIANLSRTWYMNQIPI